MLHEKTACGGGRRLNGGRLNGGRLPGLRRCLGGPALTTRTLLLRLLEPLRDLRLLLRFFAIMVYIYLYLLIITQYIINVVPI